MRKKSQNAGEKLEKSTTEIAVAPRFYMSRWPGQVPDRDAIEALKLAKQEPPKFSTARLLAHDGAYLKPSSVVDGIGLDPAKMNEWIGCLKKASNHANELTFRQEIMGKMLHDRMDPASRQALFQRAMGYYRDMRKSLVDVVTPDELRKSEGEGSRGGHVIGHTAGGAPIYDKSHADMMQFHSQAMKDSRESGDHETANRHMYARNAHRKAIYLPRPGGTTGGSPRPNQTSAAHEAWDATQRTETGASSPSPDRLHKSLMRRVRQAPLGLPLAKLDDLVRRYGQRAVAETLEKACRDRDGLTYRNGVLKSR